MTGTINPYSWRYYFVDQWIDKGSQALDYEEALSERLGRMTPVSLEEMGKVRLMNRVDTKYLTTGDVLVRLLEMAADDYFVQETAGERNLPYFTRYFDTAGELMYNEHQRGRKTRQKVRIREYVSSGVKFLEVKTKNNKGRTKKKRIGTGGYALGTTHDPFLVSHTPWTSPDLHPRLENRFRRITLVNRAMTERLTIDTSLNFHNMKTGADRSLDGLVVIELKRDGNTVSPASAMLRELRIRPHGFSKYCMGMAFTDPGLRRNRIRERMRSVLKMIARPAPEASRIPPETVRTASPADRITSE